MFQIMGNTSGTNTTANTNDKFSQVLSSPFVVCDCGLCWSWSYSFGIFHNRTTPTISETEVIGLRNRVYDLEDRLEKMNDDLNRLAF